MLQSLLIRSAREYFDFLEKRNRSLEEIAILRSYRDSYGIVLEIKARLLSFENLLLQNTHGYSWRIGDDGIEARSYDEKRGILSLECSEKTANLLLDSPLKLFSDLKFLVKNVERFFIEYGDSLKLPNNTNIAPPVAIERLSKEQNEAVNILFSNPLSYIWGAPGTGKTRGVLFESMLHSIMSGARIFLLAPTNNALELALVALMEKFDELGASRDRVMRLGTPSSDFLSRYPEACDPISMRTSDGNLFDWGEIKQNREERMEESLVLAMTVDNFIKRFESLPKCKHIFLDEAAFTPLIKALAICVVDVPLTLLGDHKQLPPVCEMSERDIKDQKAQNVRAWQYSALYISQFFKLGEELFASERIEPNFANMNTARLTYSHRYGKNLTQILDSFIYKINLDGLCTPTRLEYADSGKHEPKENELISENEVKLIKTIVENLSKTNEDFGIITPFVKQKGSILSELPSLRGSERVMTIHGSQGREFDTIIISPVMLHYHLTNSKNKNALHAINVAISRAKKRLIIVCDYEFWRAQRDQFLSAILEQCTKLELPQINKNDATEAKNRHGKS